MISTKNIENHLQNFCVKMDIQLRDIHPGHKVGKMDFVCFKSQSSPSKITIFEGKGLTSKLNKKIGHNWPHVG